MSSHPPEPFLRILNRSGCIVGNSSVAIRECAFMGVPAVNIGTRQEGRERGRNVLDVPHDRGAILEAARNQVGHGRYEPDPIYGDGSAGTRIADLLSRVPLSIGKRLPY